MSTEHRSWGYSRSGQGAVLWYFKRMVGPALLILLCPPFAMLLWYTHVKLGGSILSLGELFLQEGIPGTLALAWRPVLFGTPLAWTILATYAAVQLALMRLLPGPEHRGPVTATGNVPLYRANGPLAFGVTVGLYCICSFGLGLFPASILYHRMGELLGALNIFALAFCLALYLKGRLAPSSSDHSVSGHFIFDYYWGTELYPRVLGWDVKMFTNCRFAMMGWPLLLISYAAAQHELHGLTDAMAVSVGLQLIYIAKFFWWETGYLGSMDIMHDRAGFYICWGVLVWLPSTYTAHSLFLVHHPNHLGLPLAAVIFAGGIAGIVINYWADAQRQTVRATQGQCKVWGKVPELITATYQTDNGEQQQSLLLVSGWWGISRHFHYLPELLAAFCWVAPVGLQHLLPWFYFIFLCILLTQRAFRDDRRCAEKYGAHWDEYRRRVPYRMIPGIL